MSNTKIVPFDQMIFQLFFDIIRASGVGLNLDQIEKMRAASTRLAVAMDAQVQLTCLEHLKTFQGNAKEAVEVLEARIAKLEPAPVDYDRMAQSLAYARGNDVEALEARIAFLERSQSNPAKHIGNDLDLFKIVGSNAEAVVVKPLDVFVSE